MFSKNQTNIQKMTMEYCQQLDKMNQAKINKNLNITYLHLNETRIVSYFKKERTKEKH